MARIYHCVDLETQYSEDIEASSPDVAMKRFFQIRGISENPVRSAKQTHGRKYDCRFYAKTNHDNHDYRDYDYRTRHVFVGFNREGFEYDACSCREFEESLGKDLTWNECSNL